MEGQSDQANQIIVKKGGIKFGLSITIIVIFIIAAAVAVYWINSEQWEEIDINIIIPRINWYSYQNEKYGFKIDYPDQATTTISSRVSIPSAQILYAEKKT